MNTLKSSFQLVAEVTLTKDNLGEKSPWTLDYIQSSSRLQEKASFCFNLDNLAIDAKLTGFMNMGQKIGERVFWEKKWCVLRETQLKIFNYPSFEDFVDPIYCLNLIYSVGPCMSTVNGKRKSFVLKIARPGTANDVDRPSLRTRPNFVLEKFYFSGDNFGEYQKWNEEIQDVMQALVDWKKIIFVDEDTEYSL